ncbi:Metallo-dependent phosphatase-like protein [Schizophyllum commune]
MNKEMHRLLDKLSYDESSDKFIHVGDIVAKGPHKGSLAVLTYMSSHNITGVRGNHDQKVIEWRGWLNWIHAQPGGKKWLNALNDDWESHKVDDDRLSEWIEKAKKKHKSKWWRKVPDGWKLFSDHYRIARDMRKEDFEYLKNLPLKIHIPSAHAFIVHAGLLPSDPNYKPNHKRQPLARIPSLPKDVASSSKDATLREIQERAVLTEVPQNTDPWTNINMRSVLDDGDVTRKGNDGTPWSHYWNRDMKSCVGYDGSLRLGDEEEAAKHKDRELPCMPSTVVYGHAASRGLDVKRWSIGLDSGAVYGRRLTALVLSSKDQKVYETIEGDEMVDEDEEEDDDVDEDDEEEDEDEDDEDEDDRKRQQPALSRRKKHRKWARFGDRGRGRLVSVKV